MDNYNITTETPPTLARPPSDAGRRSESPADPCRPRAVPCRAGEPPAAPWNPVNA